MVDSIRALDPACLPLYGMSFFCSNAGFSHITGISCQQHTIPAHPQNIHIQTQQKSGGKYDVRPGLYTEPGRDPPGLLPTNKAGILEVMKEVHHPDIVNVVVHFISPFSNGGRYEAYGRRTAPANSLKIHFAGWPYSTLLPGPWAAADGLCWHTSRESHPSEDLSELPPLLDPGITRGCGWTGVSLSDC